MPSKDFLNEPQKEFVELELVTQADKIPDASQPQKRTQTQKSQIVDQPEKALNDEIPKEARFFSQNNQVVKKETRAANRGEFQNAKSWKSFQPQSQFLKPKDESQETQKKELGDWEQKKAKNKKENSTEVTQNPIDESGNVASATLDYISDIDVGLETLLSTKEFKYYTYFRRIRNQLNQHWTPKVKKSVLNVYRNGRRIALDQDLVTRTIVVLNPEGYLLKVLVIGNSGFRELDRAALEALKEAAPFKNPPKGMIDPDGLVRIRWDFVIEG
jgi:protein TonB